jgi:distribution and morphology protein 12
MSIDLEWGKLDSSLANYVVEVLNRQLSTAARPSFIGSIEVTSLDFGSAAPDVELVDLRDIYRDFLEEDDDDLDRGPVKVTEGPEDVEGFEWVSRRAAGREETLAYQYLPPHVRYGRGGPSELFASMPTIGGPISHSASMDRLTPNFAEYRPPLQPLWQSTPMYRNPAPSTPFTAGPFRHNTHEYMRKGTYSQTLEPHSDDSIGDSSPGYSELPPKKDLPPPTAAAEPPRNPHPNLQLHLRINWHSNLRMTLTTSLLINYPSPMFMSLPIKLSITGLVFDGEVAVAYEGERRRVHICILDDLDPYGPAVERPKRESAGSSLTPPELEDESPPTTIPPRPSKPLPIGQRLLPSIYIESEIGQADKHVLKNVTRVERFIQDVIRKTVEEELVFPNFHTLLLGDL